MEKFSPSDKLCEDEIFRRGYGLGGDWCYNPSALSMEYMCDS